MVWANISLSIAIFSLAVALGGGFYESVVINPQWSQNPPTSFALIQENTGVPLQKFWIPTHILISVAVLLALFLNWKVPTRRNLIFVALGSYAIMRAWSFMYFIPEMLEFQKIALESAQSDDLLGRVSKWKTLTYWRMPLDLISFFCLTWALAVANNET